MFASYFNESILKRAQEIGAIDIRVHNIRDWTTNKHRTVDDVPYGGGAGMVMKVEPIHRALKDLLGDEYPENREKLYSRGVRVVLFSAKGQRLKQSRCAKYSQLSQIILICGRYEGVDERVADYLIDEEISIGDYVLTGGELPAMVMIDATTRLLPGVLGNALSLEEESHGASLKGEYPHYTRPESYGSWDVPPVLLSGNHAEIEKWRDKNAKR